MLALLIPLQVGVPGGPELLVILLVAALLFRGTRLPELPRSTGQAMGEFQNGRREVERELDEQRPDDSTQSVESTATPAESQSGS